MIEKREENLEENKIKSARRKPARRNYNKRENKINEEAKNDVKKETKNIKKEVRRTTRRVNKGQEETKALVVRKEIFRYSRAWNKTGGKKYVLYVCSRDRQPPQKRRNCLSL